MDRSTKQAICEAVDCEFNDTTRPLLWLRFRHDACFKESGIFKGIPDTHVNFTTPAPHTNRDLVVELASQAQIPIDSLPDELNGPIFSRAHVIFGYAGDEIDNVASNYPNMRWWISERGLVLAVLSREEILGQLANPDPAAPVEYSKPAATTNDKGNIALLTTSGGKLVESVNFHVAEKYAGFSRRRRQQLIKDGVLVVIGCGSHRQITVKSLIAYCPPAEYAK